MSDQHAPASDGNRGFSTLAVHAGEDRQKFGDAITDLVLVGAGNPTYHFARWRYEEPSTEPTLLDDGTDDRWKRVSNLNPTAFRQFQTELGADITDDDVFHYVYGALHSPEFRSRYESNLKKEASRVPMAPDRVTFDAYRDAGKAGIKDVQTDTKTAL